MNEVTTGYPIEPEYLCTECGHYPAHNTHERAAFILFHMGIRYKQYCDGCWEKWQVPPSPGTFEAPLV